MSSSKRVGRPKTIPQTGPLVLEGDRARMKIEVELSTETAAELKEYSRWVELSSGHTTADAVFTTVDYALRKLFRRDRLWQAQRREGARAELPAVAQRSPAPQAALPALPPPTRVAAPTRTTAGPL